MRRPELGWTPPNRRMLDLIRVAVGLSEDSRLLEEALDTLAGGLNEDTYRLAPLLYYRLDALGCEHPSMHTLATHYRNSWLQSAYRERLLARAVVALREVGIEPLLLKGVALASYYPTRACRVAGDIDLLVPEDSEPELVEKVMGAELGMDGWYPAPHARNFSDGSSHVDIHKYLGPALAYPGSSVPLWESSVRVGVSEMEVRTLRPEHHVFHVMTHGMAKSNGSVAHWAVDASLVVNSTPGFDAARLFQLAETQRLGLMVQTGWNWLVQEHLLHEQAQQYSTAPGDVQIQRALCMGENGKYFDLWQMPRRLRRMTTDGDFEIGQYRRNYLRVPQGSATFKILQHLWTKTRPRHRIPSGS